MPNEMVRYRRTDLVERADRALETLRNVNVPAARSASPVHPPRIDLMRRCAALGGLPWAAVRIHQGNGVYICTTSIELSESDLWTQYASTTQRIVVHDLAPQEETCARCRVKSMGAYKCGCGQLVCGGLTSGHMLATTRYFRCYCGREGWTSPAKLDQIGLIPGLSS